VPYEHDRETAPSLGVRSRKIQEKSRRNDTSAGRIATLGGRQLCRFARDAGAVPGGEKDDGTRQAAKGGVARGTTGSATGNNEVDEAGRTNAKEGLGKISTDTNQATGKLANQELDLHKSWHCLHFMLTGKAEETGGTPLGDAILGGVEIGGEEADTGYGPPRALKPAQVRAVADALADFPIDQRAQEFDAMAAEKAGIYVAKHDPEELNEYFGKLRSFYDDAARKGNAVILWIE